MAKEKSLKLRTILSILALYKHSDKDHRLTPRKMNAFLKPFGLNITGVGLADDVRIMQEFGLDAHTNEGAQAHSAYIDEHLISDEMLKRLIFAVSTNPHIRQGQATEIMQHLKPLVTAYQEPSLQSFVQNQGQEPDDSLYWAYSVVKEAIRENRRILYTIDYAKYNCVTKAMEPRREWETMFTPKQLVKGHGKLYAIGYNDTDQEPACLDLSKLSTCRLSLEYKTKKNLVAQNKDRTTDTVNIPQENTQTLYEGPAIFRCGASHIPTLYKLFGAPSTPVRQTKNHVATYEVDSVKIDANALVKLTEMATNGGVQILGPVPLQSTIQVHYDAQTNTLHTKRFPRGR